MRLDAIFLLVPDRPDVELMVLDTKGGCDCFFSSLRTKRSTAVAVTSIRPKIANFCLPAFLCLGLGSVLPRNPRPLLGLQGLRAGRLHCCGSNVQIRKSA